MLRYLRLLPVLAISTLLPARVDTAPHNLTLPANVPTILDHIYSGQRNLALEEVHQFEQQAPNDPLPYLLEAEAQWWRIWCSAAEFKYGMNVARRRDKMSGDAEYFALTSKAYALADASLHQHDSAEMHLYAGMADALASRLYSLRGEYRATARTGVRARENFLRALKLDPSLADADMGLGLYNYYVDTLSGIARVLRFFMGIPGGSKQEGVRQLEHAIRDGQITPRLAHFYLAQNLEIFDQKYEQALQVLTPLAEEYPENPVYQLVRGDLLAKLGRKPQAEAAYRAASTVVDQVPETDCRARLARLVEESLAALKGR